MHQYLDDQDSIFNHICRYNNDNYLKRTLIINLEKIEIYNSSFSDYKKSTLSFSQLNSNQYIR